MSKYRFGLTTLLFWIILVFGVILVEGMNFLSFKYMSYFDLKELILISIVVLSSILIYYIIEKKKNRAKPSWLFLPFTVIFLICGIFGIWYNGPGIYTIKDVTFDYSPDLVNRLSWTIGLVVSTILVYLMLTIWSKRILRTKSLLFPLWMVVLVCIGAIVYSLIAEFESYKYIFTISLEEGQKASYESIKSFFHNENNYGQLLMIGVFALIMIDALKHHWWHSLFMWLLYIAMIFSTSYTALSTTMLGIIVYYIYRFIATIKAKTFRNIFSLVGVFFLVGGLIALYAILYHLNVEFIINLTEYINSTILNKDFSTFTGRTIVWQRAFDLLNTPLQWIFGLGFRNFNHYYSSYVQALTGSTGPYLAVDSTYVQILGQYGILGLFTYVVFVVLFFALCIYCVAKKKDRVAFPAMILMVILMIYQGFETFVLFEMNTIGAVAFIIIILPPLIEYNNNVKSNPYLETQLMDERNDYSINKYSSKMIVQTLSMFLSAVVLGLGLSFVFNKGYLLPATFLISTFALLWFILPYLFAMWHKRASLKLLMARCIILSLLLVLIPLIVSLPLFITIEYNLVGYIIYGCVFVLVMFIEFSFTLLIQSLPKEFIKLVWYFGIRPFVIPLAIVLTIALPLGICLNYFYGLTMFSAIMFISAFLIIYFLLVYFVKNIKNCKKHNQFLIDEMNNRFIRRQKMCIVLGKK